MDKVSITEEVNMKKAKLRLARIVTIRFIIRSLLDREYFSSSHYDTFYPDGLTK